MRSSWIAGALVSSLWMTGCAQDAQRVDEATLGRLPMEQKQEVFTAQHNVSVAQANMQSAERSLREGKQFRDISKSEFDASTNRVAAASKAMDLSRKSNNQEALGIAEQNMQLGERQLAAERAKVDYAERVVSLREAENDLANKQFKAAQAEQNLAELAALRRAGMQPQANMADAMRLRDESNTQVAEAERKVASLRDEAQATRTAWEQARQRYAMTVRETPVAPPIRAPQAPQMIQPEPLRVPATPR